MKRLLWSLLKINAIALTLFFGFALLLGSTRNVKPNAPLAIFLAACVAYVFYLNVRTIYRARQEVSASLRDGAINAAANAIEIRDAARARVNERLEERRQRSDDNHG